MNHVGPDEKRIRQTALELVEKMTLEEKAGLCSGKDCWTTKPIERLGLEAIMVSDGPHGLRKQIGAADNLGIGESLPSVCFPTASALACSFDRELVYQVGKAIGEECLQEGVSVILGPGVNQKRSPLCGRNFEYFSEDPVLSGEMAAGMIKGVQSTGIGTSLKHFAVNNQEKRRMTVNAVVDERTLRETYLRAFEIAVKKGRPDTVMCAYNRLNGEYCSENTYLLTDILRDEWGFDGAVISDWGAVNDRALGVKAGLDLEMPGNDGYNDAKIIRAVQQGSLSMDALDYAACRVTELILKGMQNKKTGYRYDAKEHHSLAVRAAEQSAVLLKNEGGLLPGHQRQKVLVIGAFAKIPRYQGAGSSKIHPLKVDTAWEAFVEEGMDVVYAEGYQVNSRSIYLAKNRKEERSLTETMIQEACEAAKGKDIVYLFAGLTEGYESEGFDRRDLSLPAEQNRLIEAVAKANQNLVIVLCGGAPMELPWLHKVRGVLLAYLGGEGGGKAIVNLLLGKAVPCGKLAETWPLSLKDTPAYVYYPGGRQTVEHRESIYVGYRYYEKAEKQVLFPFGYGLSYTNFTYSDISLDRDSCDYQELVTLKFKITNSGQVAAGETALIFVSHNNDKVFVPKKELKDFVKLVLLPGETKEVSIALDTSTFGYYNTLIKAWYAPGGLYQIIVGSSSADCVLEASLKLHYIEKPQTDYRLITPSYFKLAGGIFEIPDTEFEALYGRRLPISNAEATRPYHSGNTLEDVKHTLIGKLLCLYADHLAKTVTQSEEEQQGMMAAMMKEMPFHAMVASGDKIISECMMEGILDLLNRHYLKGIRKLLR